MLPFIKNGRVIPNTFIYCECHEDEPEYYHPLLPEDFDFPMSYDFRCYVAELNGETLPSIEPTLSTRDPEIVNKEPEWSRRQWAIVLSLQDEVRGFRERFYKGLNEIKQKSTPKGKSKY